MAIMTDTNIMSITAANDQPPLLIQKNSVGSDACYVLTQNQ